MKCSHCCGSRHTKNGCFKLIRYPEWWEDLQKRKVATKAPVNRAGSKALLIKAETSGGEHTGVGEEAEMAKEGGDGMRTMSTEGERYTKTKNGKNIEHVDQRGKERASGKLALYEYL